MSARELPTMKDGAVPAETGTQIAMLLYPGFTALDLIGPQQVLAQLPDTRVDLVAKTAEPVVSDAGVTFVPDLTFDDATADYDIIFVPGGPGSHVEVEDAETLAFVGKVGTNARYVTSVCSGSLILGAAGLLDGYRAGSHWAVRHFLSAYGATPEDSRVVVDRNRFTGGGVTAGIDFGLTLAAELAGEAVAKRIQLTMEYDPHPPFDEGHPSRASEETLAQANERLAPSVTGMEDVVSRMGDRR